MTISFEQFEDACDAERVGLNKAVAIAGENRKASLRYSRFDGAPYMAPIIEAGLLLREDPDAELVTKPIKRVFQSDTLAAALCAVLNSTVQREQAEFEGGQHPLDVCHEAETYFMSLFCELESEEPPRCEIFANNQEPLFVRKRNGGAPSAMSLASISVERVVYPAFSLFRLEAKGDKWFQEVKTHRLQRSSIDGVHVRGVGDIETVTFLRPSVFSVSPTERSAHFGTDIGSDAEEFDMRIPYRTMVGIIEAATIGVA